MSGSNLDKLTYADGMFESRIKQNGDMLEEDKETKHETKLLSNTSSADFSVIKVSDVKKFEVHELTCGTQDIRYSVLKHYGGVKDDDLFQSFEHLAVNTMSLSVTPGQIITGSFGFMGSNNPEIVQWGNQFSPAKEFIDGETYYKCDESKPKYEQFTEADPQPTAETFVKDKYFLKYPCGVVKQLSKRLLSGKGASALTKEDVDVMHWLDDLPQKGTSTDQYTAREGFLYINGERVRYGSNLTFELNNGLEKTFAIFEKDAISMSPLTLDITGNLGAYLIKGYSEKLYQLAVQDKNIELVFCFQDKEENPEALYLFQIFKAKFTDTDVSTGAEQLEVSFPYQSFEEKAVRILRTRMRKARSIEFDTENKNKITVDFTTKPVETPTVKDTTCKVTVDGVEVAATLNTDDFETSGKVSFTFAAIDASAKVIDFVVTYNGNAISKEYNL